jgi:hypothetical protein
VRRRRKSNPPPLAVVGFLAVTVAAVVGGVLFVLKKPDEASAPLPQPEPAPVFVPVVEFDADAFADSNTRQFRADNGLTERREPILEQTRDPIVARPAVVVGPAQDVFVPGTPEADNGFGQVVEPAGFFDRFNPF